VWLLVSRARCERNHWAIRENVREEFLGNRGIARGLNARGVATARRGQWTRCQLARAYGVLSLIYVPTEANIPILEAGRIFEIILKGGRYRGMPLDRTVTVAPRRTALPSTLAADESSGGLGVKMTFERVIGWAS
jgi:hypothetical protein